MGINSINLKKTSVAIIASLALATALIAGLLFRSVNAASVIKISSNVAEVQNGEDFKLTIGIEDPDTVRTLEVDHSLASAIPEFSVVADEANPYGDASDKADFEAAGVTVTYDASLGEWVIDFGPTVTDIIKTNGGEIKFYLALRGNTGAYLWGSMKPTSPDNTFVFDLLNGSGDEIIPEIQAPSVPNTGIIRQ